MKKNIAFILLFSYVVFMSGCDTYRAIKNYPWYQSSTWYCEEIDMAFTFLTDTNGDLIESPPCQLSIHNQIYSITVNFHSNSVSFLSEADMNNTVSGLLEGVWRYDNKKLIISVLEDNLFGGEYEELVFIPQ